MTAGAEPASLAEVKRAGRAAAMARRAAAHRQADGAAARAAGHLLDLLASFDGVGIVSSYLAIRDELDPMPAMLALAASGYRVCAPVIEAKGRPLGFREWTPQARLVRGAFDVQVPETGAPLVPQALVVPLLAFDRDGNRLGYGGGFYDRTIAALRARSPVRAIGFCYAAQEIERVPVDPTDARLDAIVTEHGILRPPA